MYIWSDQHRAWNIQTESQVHTSTMYGWTYTELQHTDRYVARYIPALCMVWPTQSLEHIDLFIRELTPLLSCVPFNLYIYVYMSKFNWRPLFLFHDSNPSGPLINRPKCFRIIFRFRWDIQSQSCLHSVQPTTEEKNFVCKFTFFISELSWF